ncbi:hypothetical protein AAFX20_09565 [Vibrio chagasii]|uniref:hypothetical protein n=1 Tax=Vibrio chagasii TaxID=170679 RepID=UPI0038CD3AB4
MKTPSSKHILISTMLILSGLLAGCKDKNLFDDVKVDNTEVETRPFQIRDVVITSDTDTYPVKSLIMFEVFAETDPLFDGPQDIAAHKASSRVNISALPELKLESSDPEILYIPEREVLGIARKAGVVRVYAHFRGVQSAPLTLEILPELTSCGGVDDTDKLNASGACLKVLTGLTGEAKDKWFTSTPSLGFLDALNYLRSDTVANTGKSYAATVLGLGQYATQQTRFGLFRQDGRNATLDGIDGQYDRYCQNLAQLSFLARSDWRRATGQELVDLFQDLGHLFQNYGFFNKVVYWSASQFMQGQRAAQPYELYRIGLYKGSISATDPSLSLAASCVSTQSDAITHY